MILHIVKCEMCENQFQFQPVSQIQEYTPDAWFTVFQGNPEGQEPRHYCSKGCLRSWLTNQLTANDISLPSESADHKPYPYCCSLHYPIGGRL